MKFFWTLCMVFIALSAGEVHKAMYDLTTAKFRSFEMKLLKGIPANMMQYAWDDKELKVVVIIHGGAYRYFIKNPQLIAEYKDDVELIKNRDALEARLKVLHDEYEVEFLVCGSGLDARGIKRDDVYKFVTIIPNASLGLIQKQNEGYAYIPAH
ncbi:MAG: DsrE family protein [Epsilonproteobacteria bacterium]|nr:DsrE family protein [Campylobacterota bacterium]